MRMRTMLRNMMDDDDDDAEDDDVGSTLANT